VQQDTFISHLIELRERLVRASGVVLVLFLIFSFGWPGAGAIYDFLAAPLMHALPEGAKMIATGVITPFMVPMKVATAPTPGSLARNAATSAPRSKSALWIVTRGRFTSASGDRRKEPDLCPFGHDGRVVAKHLVQRAAHGPVSIEHGRVSGIARDQQASHRAHCRTGCDLDRFAGTERLAHRSEIADRHLHDSNSAKAR